MIRITRERTFVGASGVGEVLSLDAGDEKWLVETGQAVFVEDLVPEDEKYLSEVSVKAVVAPESVEDDEVDRSLEKSGGEKSAPDAEGTASKGRRKRRSVV